MDFDRLFGINANASDRARSYEREQGLRQVSLIIADKLGRGQITKEMAQDATAALAGHILNEGVGRPESYRAMVEDGSLEYWRQLAAGRDLNESPRASEQRHEDALRIVLGQMAVDAYERGAINDDALVEYATDINPQFVEQVRHEVGATRALPGDLDGKLAPLSTSQELHAVVHGESLPEDQPVEATEEPTVGDCASERDLEHFFAAREAQDSLPQPAEAETSTTEGT
jgi:hypothetical protein